MAFVDQVLSLPYAYLWLPGLMFLGIVGGIVLLMRREARLVLDAATAAEEAEQQPLVKFKAAEQRVAFRRQGNPVPIYVGKPDDKDNPEPGCVLDRSVGGMRLALFHPVTNGAILSIRPVNADQIVPWIDLEVRSCRSSDEMPGHFEIGCQYVKSPPYSLQLLFG